MKRSNRYEEAKVIGDYRRLPKGNYVCKIMGVKVKENRNGGERFEISYDIAEGDYAHFFEDDYKSNSDENKKWRGIFNQSVPDDDSPDWMWNQMKTFTNALEESNNGYHWDWNENKWKGLIFGGLFRVEEFVKNDGTVGSTVRLYKARPANDVRNGTAPICRDKLIENKPDDTDDFAKLPDTIDDLPFD